MSKELVGLNVPRIMRESRSVECWLNQHHGSSVNLPIYRFLIGLTPVANEKYFPIEINLRKRGPKAVFLVGGETSGKEKVMKGLIKRASMTTSSDYMTVDVISAENAPQKLTNDKILSRIVAKFYEPLYKTDELHLLLLEDLGGFLEKNVEVNPFIIEKARKIIGHVTKLPILSVIIANASDLPLMEQHGFTPETTPGFWFFGKSEIDEQFQNIIPGTFYLLNRKTMKFDQTPILSFED